MDLAAGAKEIPILLDGTTRPCLPCPSRHCEYKLTTAVAVRRIYPDLALDATPDGLVMCDDIDLPASGPSDHFVPIFARKKLSVFKGFNFLA